MLNHHHLRRQLLLTVAICFVLLFLVFQSSEVGEAGSQNLVRSQNPVLQYLRGLQEAVSEVKAKIEEKKSEASSDGEATVWVSMGLCWSKTTHLYGKRSYPYATVTPLAVLLWKYYTSVSVLVTIVYDEREPPFMLVDYTETLKDAGAEVRWVKSEGTDCVLASQLTRMLAFTNKDLIADDDVVMTVDVNAFVMTDKILDPILDNQDRKVWVYQYAETADISTGNGETFNQNLMSMRAETWREVLDFRTGATMQSWIEERIVELELDRDNQWYYDQWITTYAIIKHKYCTVPEVSGLWNLPHLRSLGDWDSDSDDSGTCWHGKGYKDCNEEIRIVYQGCKWWHFYPTQKFEDHVEKFLELTNHTIKLNFLKARFQED